MSIYCSQNNHVCSNQWEKRDIIPLSEILLNSLSSVSSRLSLRSTRAPLKVLYIKYWSASVLGISTLFVWKWRDLLFCSDMQHNQIRGQYLNSNTIALITKHKGIMQVIKSSWNYTKSLRCTTDCWLFHVLHSVIYHNFIKQSLTQHTRQQTANK